MKDKKLMRLIIDCPNFVKEKMLSDDQRYLFSEVECQPDGVTSAFISDLLDISIQSASGRLVVLFKKKYLKRTERIAESGGIEYVYECAID